LGIGLFQVSDNHLSYFRISSNLSAVTLIKKWGLRANIMPLIVIISAGEKVELLK